MAPPEVYQPKRIPGDTDPRVTRATIQKTICVHSYTATVRAVTEADKKFVLKRDGATQPSEVDHLVSLEIGGSNDRDKHLWAQPYAGQFAARVKMSLKLTCIGSSARAKCHLPKPGSVSLTTGLHVVGRSG
jgi:hypothetical protein